MNNQKNNLNPSGNPQEEMIGRRELLKALAATSGAVVAASMLPGKWSEPVIEAGVLPAHAQGTPAPSTPAPRTDTVVIVQTAENNIVMRINNPNQGPDYRRNDEFRQEVGEGTTPFVIYFAYDGPDTNGPNYVSSRPTVEYYLESDSNDREEVTSFRVYDDGVNQYPNNFSEGVLLIQTDISSSDSSVSHTNEF